jgi:hypothetical protein
MTEQQRLRELGDFAELFRSPWFRLGEWDKIGFRLSDDTAEQLAWLLTVAIRQSRFVEGGLVTWHENGWLLAICQRAKTLADLT